jgi:hypothetical protein
MMVTGIEAILSMPQTRRYPEWRSLRKTRGRRDASLKARANRRKAQRRKP